MRVVKRRDLISFIRDRGAYPVRTKGSHEAWVREGVRGTATIVTSKDDIEPKTIRSVLRQLELSEEDLERFLGR